MKQIEKVLYVIDDDLEGMETLRRVLLMAEELGWQLTLFNVIESSGSSARMLVTLVSPDELKARIVASRKLQLEALISMVTHDSCDLKARVAFGNRAKEIKREFANDGYDLLIKRGENNSIDKFLLKNCDQPVWLLSSDDLARSEGSLVDLAPGFVADEQPRGESLHARGQ